MAFYRRNFGDRIVDRPYSTYLKLKLKLLGMIKTINSLLAPRTPIDLNQFFFRKSALTDAVVSFRELLTYQALAATRRGFLCAILGACRRLATAALR